MRYIKKDENGIVVAASEIQFDETYELSDEEYEVGFDGKIYSKTEMDSTEYVYLKQKFEKETEKELKIYELKKNLAESDYKLLKFIDGSLTESEYAPIRKQRQKWRDEINEIENK